MNSLAKGILFEGSQEFLTWGEPLNRIVNRLSARIIEKGDRTIYNWGDQTILNGLKVNLSTTRWKSISNLLDSSFTELDSWTIGDKEAQNEYSRISEHLMNNLGDPYEQDESLESEKFLKWKLDNISITILFFDQHCYKSVLTVKKE